MWHEQGRGEPRRAAQRRYHMPNSTGVETRHARFKRVCTRRHGGSRSFFFSRRCYLPGWGPGQNTSDVMYMLTSMVITMSTVKNLIPDNRASRQVGG